jgi:hypothetical protein
MEIVTLLILIILTLSTPFSPEITEVTLKSNSDLLNRFTKNIKNNEV